MDTRTSLVVYLVLTLVTWAFAVRWSLVNLKKDSLREQLTDEDYKFSLIWGLFIGCLWPLFAPLYLLSKTLTFILVPVVKRLIR